MDDVHVVSNTADNYGRTRTHYHGFIYSSIYVVFFSEKSRNLQVCDAQYAHI